MKPNQKIIANRYKVISELGVGSIGVVYKCLDKVMGNIVALKLLLDIDSMDGARRFHLEAKVTAQLDHPNIVRILDFGEEEGQLYIVLEYVEGKSLERIIEKERPDLSEAISIFVQITRGLAYANKHGILHRDLKPSNLIITPGNQVKIVDFGLAKLNTENQMITKTGMAIGTPAYMSPEAALGNNLDIRSDIYSLGCIMFETLSGHLPFDAESSMTQMLVRTGEAAPALNDEIDPIFPPEIAYIVDKCLESEPDNRFQNVHDIESLLVEYQEMDEPETAIDEPFLDNEQIPVFEKTSKKSSKLLLTSVSILICLALYPLISLMTKPQKTKTKAFTKEANVFLGMEADDLEAKVKKVKQEGKLWHSLWGISYNKDLDKLKPFKNIKHLKLLEGNLVGLESSRICDFNLVSLDLKLSVVSDQILKNVGKIKSLEFLRLDKVHGLTSSALRHLSKLENLEILWLRRTDIDDNAIPYIAKIKNLKIIHLGDSKNLTGKNLDILSSLPHLEELYLENLRLQPRYLSNLEKLGKLNMLDLRGNGITDSKLRHLEKLQVKALDLKVNPITAKAWKSFSKMKNLKRLYLTYERSKSANLQKENFKKSLPRCTVYFSSK